MQGEASRGEGAANAGRMLGGGRLVCQSPGSYVSGPGMCGVCAMNWADELIARVRAEMPITFFGNTDREVSAAMVRLIRETIERCAEVIDAMDADCRDGNIDPRDAAASIRALGRP